MDEVFDFLKACGTYYLATVEGDQPRVRPFGTIHIFEGRTKNDSRQLQQNPKAELCAFSKGTWLRVAGTLRDDPRPEAKAHLLAQYPGLQSRYAADDPDTQVLYFETAEATFSSFGGEPRTVRF